MATEHWTTRDGRGIRIECMDDRHLLNAIRLCERAAEQCDQSPSEYCGYDKLCAEREDRIKRGVWTMGYQQHLQHHFETVLDMVKKKLKAEPLHDPKADQPNLIRRIRLDEE